MNKHSTKGQIIGANVVRLRERRGWSTARLARELGVALNTVQAIERGDTQKSKFLPDIARIFGVPLSEIDPSQTHIQLDVLPLKEVAGPRDLPVYGTTEAGEGVMVMTSEPVDRADRPASLLHVADAYGVIVRGNSMDPAAPAGSIAVVNPHLHPRRDDLCVFRCDDHGEFRSIIKEFVGITADGWRVKRYKPDEKEYTIKKADWPECHVVVTIHRR